MSQALVIPDSSDAGVVRVGRGPLALAIAAWLDSKHGRSGSTRTRDAYAATLADFRAALGQVGLDLDPRRGPRRTGGRRSA